MDASILARLLDLAIRIQQIPAPTFAEAQRIAFLRERFAEISLEEIQVDEFGNLYGKLRGAGTAPPLVVSAHCDTIFPASTDLTYHCSEGMITAPGIGDNAVGLAALCALAWLLQQDAGAMKPLHSYLPGDLWLVATTCEEGLGDLRGMRAVVERFGANPLAYLVLEGMALGQIYHRGLGVRRYRITAKGAGGHSWADFGRPSAVHELANLVSRLTSLPLPTAPRTSLNVGIFSGGIAVNAIASEAYIEVDLRSESALTLTDLARRVESLVASADRQDLHMSFEVIGDRPAGEIPPEHPLVQLAMRSLKAVGIQPVLSIGSTDANIPLSRGLPAVCMGLTTGSGAHTLKESIYLQPLEQGLRCLLMVVEGVFRELFDWRG
jgi:tripeptide aminopeptidase